MLARMADAQQPPGAVGNVPPLALGAYQFEIYGRGLGGETPLVPLEYEELEARARAELPAEAWGYAAGGAGEGRTIAANRAAFDRWSLVPRMLADVARARLDHGRARDEAERAGPARSGRRAVDRPPRRRAGGRAGGRGDRLPQVLSTAASTSIEDVAAAAGDAPRWFQLYWPNDPELWRSLVARAEAAGYTAIVVTLDTRFMPGGRGPAGAYLPFLLGEGMRELHVRPGLPRAARGGARGRPRRGRRQVGEVFPNPSMTWEDLPRLREHTSLPILVKGVLHPDDARRAVDLGIDGVVVSNHGGRQVDGR